MGTPQHGSDEAIDRLLLGLFNNELYFKGSNQRFPFLLRQIFDPSTVMSLSVKAAPTMEKGSLDMISGGVRVPARDVPHFAGRVSEISGISCRNLESIPDDSDAYFVINNEGPISAADIWIHGAPWFVSFFGASNLVPLQIRGKVANICTAFVSGIGRAVYRGENRLHKSVSSGLCRRFNTNNRDALRLIQQRHIREAQPGHPVEMSDASILFAMQHLGGLTNLIDFSLHPWIALYFACEGDEAMGEDGRLLVMDGPYDSADLAFYDQNSIDTSNIAYSRIHNQMGLLVEPATGEIDASNFRFVGIIRAEEKPLVLDMLRGLGITRETLFKDIFEFITVRQKTTEVPEEAWLSIMSEYIEKRLFCDVVQHCNSLLHQGGHPMDKVAAWYFRGMAHALMGNFDEAKQDMDMLRQAATENRVELSKVAAQNIALVDRACRSRPDPHKLFTRLDLTVDGPLVWVSFPGYRDLRDGGKADLIAYPGHIPNTWQHEARLRVGP